MGYYARGGGDATLKKGTDTTKLKEILDQIIKDLCSEMEYEFLKSGENEVIDFSESDDHWHEEDTFKFLYALNPYITEGSTVYDGEDGSKWMYAFIPDKECWEERCGYTFYTEEEMISHLSRLGYKIKKAS